MSTFRRGTAQAIVPALDQAFAIFTMLSDMTAYGERLAELLAARDAAVQAEADASVRINQADERDRSIADRTAALDAREKQISADEALLASDRAALDAQIDAANQMHAANHTKQAELELREAAVSGSEAASLAKAADLAALETTLETRLAEAEALKADFAAKVEKFAKFQADIGAPA